jgi:hypothetical protein
MKNSGKKAGFSFRISRAEVTAKMLKKRNETNLRKNVKYHKNIRR